MKEVMRVVGFIAVLAALAAVMAWLLLGCGVVEAAKKEPTQFIKGLEYGKSFLKPGSKKGKHFRKGVVKASDRFGPWFWYFGKWEFIPLCSRAWLESRLNYWSRTKDTHLEEAGLMSNAYAFTVRVCKEYGVCGDPCGDPRFSIALSAFRRYLEQRQMMYGVKVGTNDEPTFWSDWLPDQAADNYYEARAFMGMCGSANCQKVVLAIKRADAQAGILSYTGQDGKMHVWWQLMTWFRSKPDEYFLREVEAEAEGEIVTKQEGLFAPLPEGISIWRFGQKWGRMMATLNMRAEFHEPLQSDDGDKPERNYCWSETGEPYFPTRIEWEEVGGVLVARAVPDLPEPLYPLPKHKDWRKRCILYGQSKAWRNATGEPKNPKAKYKKTACVDGVCWEKGQRKYPAEEDFLGAWNAWFDAEQEAERLPTDEEFAAWPGLMTEAGCTLTYVVDE